MWRSKQVQKWFNAQQEWRMGLWITLWRRNGHPQWWRRGLVMGRVQVGYHKCWVFLGRFFLGGGVSHPNTSLIDRFEYHNFSSLGKISLRFGVFGYPNPSLAAAAVETDITQKWPSSWMVKTSSTISWTTMIPWSRLGFYFHGFAIVLKLRKSKGVSL